MNGPTKKLDKLLLKEKHKSFRFFSVVVALTILAFGALVSYSTGESVEIKGEVAGIIDRDGLFIFVKIEGANEIWLKKPREVSVRLGDKVILMKRKTNLFGLTNYTFQKVIK